MLKSVKRVRAEEKRTWVVWKKLLRDVAKLEATTRVKLKASRVAQAAWEAASKALKAEVTRSRSLRDGRCR